MPSNIEAAKHFSTASLDFLYQWLTTGERDSWCCFVPIHAAQLMAFSGMVTIRERRASLRLLSDFTPVMIAANEMCDVGLAAERKRQECTPWHYLSLFQLQKNLEDQLKKQIDALKNKHDLSRQQEGALDAFINDLSIAARAIPNVQPKDYKEFSEIDQAVFMVGCLGVSLPEVFEKSAIDSTKKCLSYEDLIEKYQLFLKQEAEDPVEKALLGLFAIQMILKIADDQKGEQTDARLGLPNFQRYIRIRCQSGNYCPEEIIQEIRREYFELAKRMGFSQLVPRIAEILIKTTAEISHWLSNRNIQAFCPEELNRLMNGKKHRASNRERLVYSGAIGDLFN